MVIKLSIYAVKTLFLNVLTTISSPFVVLIGMPFVKEDKSRETEFTIHKSPDRIKKHYDLPMFFKWFRNIEDGMTGDHRGWYWNTYCYPWVPDWMKMWWWSGWRNPANYIKRNILGVDVRNCNIVKVKGQDFVRDDFDNVGGQILRVDDLQGDTIHWAIYYVKRWGKSNRALVIQIGAKVKLEHNNVFYEDEADYFKGVTFEFNPIKDIS